MQSNLDHITPRFRTKAKQPFQRLGHLTNTIFEVYRQKYGQAYVDIFRYWPEIVGPKLEKELFLSRLHFQKASKDTKIGILTLKCTNAMKPFVQAMEPQILSRVNQYFGYQAISKIFLQTAILKPKSSVKPQEQSQEWPVEQQQKLRQSLETIQDDCLKESLYRLGLQILKNGHER